MGIVNDIISSMPIPKMVAVRQIFDSRKIKDTAKEVKVAFERATFEKSQLSGMRIAVTAGSRGIKNISEITKMVVELLKSYGARPFIFPAMGSHGGATAQGQTEILNALGISEATMGCPVISSMAVKKIGETHDRRPVQIDAAAAGADGIVLINRVKPHTSFSGKYESGLMKMLAIGIAKQAGAEVCHQAGYQYMSANVEKYGKAILKYSNVLFGVAILENAYDETCSIEVVNSQDIPVVEVKLLIEAKKLMPQILFSDIDVLVVDRMGKNISGLGIDPNVTGCFASEFASGPPRPDKLVVLDLTEETHGNATGIGVADITTRQLISKVDWEMTYPNAITATLTNAVKQPMTMDNHLHAIQAAIKTTRGFDKENIRMVRIPNTLHIDNILISESMISDAYSIDRVEVLSQSVSMDFNADGNLF